MRDNGAHNAWNRAWYAKQGREYKAKLAARKRARRAANPEREASYKKYTREERAAYMRAWRAKHPDKVKASNAKTYENGGREYQAAYWQRVKESKRARRKELYSAWCAVNPGKIAAYAAKRRAALLRATPAWLTEDDHWLIGEIYDLCALRTRLTGVEHHVDHFYPLKGREGCGLHVPLNLRVIPGAENMRKRNHVPLG